MPKDALLVERQAALRGKVCSNPRTVRHARVQRNYVAMPCPEPRHRVRKSVVQPGDELEQRQVGVGKPTADQVGGPARVAREHPLEVTQEFRQPIRDEVGGAPFRFATLVFVVQARRDRMMGVVRFDDEVRKCELELMRPQAARVPLRSKTVAFTEEEQDVRGLPDQAVAGLQERRRERRTGEPILVE